MYTQCHFYCILCNIISYKYYIVLCVLLVAPGALNVSNVTLVSSTAVNITIVEVSACTFIHTTSVPLSIMHIFFYVHMQLNVDSAKTCIPPPPLPVFRYHPTALRSQQNGTASPLEEVMVLLIRQNKWKQTTSPLEGLNSDYYHEFWHTTTTGDAWCRSPQSQCCTHEEVERKRDSCGHTRFWLLNSSSKATGKCINAHMYK